MFLVTTVLADTLLPPVLASYQATKVKPLLVGFWGNVPNKASNCRVTDGGFAEPPFVSKVTVKLCRVHLAVNVSLLVIRVSGANLVPAGLNHPSKVCPVLVGVAGSVPNTALCVLITFAGVGVPPFALNETVKVCAVHLAVKVSFLVIRVVVANLVPLPLNHPSKVCPDLVGLAGSVPKVASNCLVTFAGVGEPPFASNETVKVCGVQLAVNVSFLVIRVDCVNLVPSELNHPSKVCPVLVGVAGSVPKTELYALIASAGAGVPPFALNETVKLRVIHLAVNVSFLVIRVVVANLVPLELNQPSKVCPDLVGLAGNVPKVVSNCLVTLAGVGEPPFASNETVKFCRLHLAVKVSLLVILVVVANLIPSELNQPSKVWPVLVGLFGSAPKVALYCLVTFVGVGVPPFALNETVKFCGVHLAKNVTTPVIVVLAVTLVPPVAAVNQSVNVCPVLVGVGNVPTGEPEVTVLDVGFTLPPLGLKVTVNWGGAGCHTDIVRLGTPPTVTVMVPVLDVVPVLAWAFILNEPLRVRLVGDIWSMVSQLTLLLGADHVLVDATRTVVLLAACVGIFQPDIDSSNAAAGACWVTAIVRVDIPLAFTDIVPLLVPGPGLARAIILNEPLPVRFVGCMFCITNQGTLLVGVFQVMFEVTVTVVYPAPEPMPRLLLFSVRVGGGAWVTVITLVIPPPVTVSVPCLCEVPVWAVTFILKEPLDEPLVGVAVSQVVLLLVTVQALFDVMFIV